MSFHLYFNVYVFFFVFFLSTLLFFFQNDIRHLVYSCNNIVVTLASGYVYNLSVFVTGWAQIMLERKIISELQHLISIKIT